MRLENFLVGMTIPVEVSLDRQENTLKQSLPEEISFFYDTESCRRNCEIAKGVIWTQKLLKI